MQSNVTKTFKIRSYRFFDISEKFLHSESQGRIPGDYQIRESPITPHEPIGCTRDSDDTNLANLGNKLHKNCQL